MSDQPTAAPVYPMEPSIDAAPAIEPHPDVTNPVLTRDDVTDLEEPTAVADPFLAYEDGVYHMFFEVLADDLDTPAIAHAVSDDGRDWEYDQVVVNERGHFAFPHVFNWRGTWYMAPDSGSGAGMHFHGGISRVYRADDFPTEWSLVDRPLMRFGMSDPTPILYDDTWYLFGGVKDSDTNHLGICLYYADSLVGADWQEHPASLVHDPSVPGNEPSRIARPGGRPIVHDDYVDFFFQDCARRYGDKTRAFRITDLTPETYTGYELPCSPVVEAQLNHDWNHETMHHVDAGLAYSGVDNIVAVDGSPEDRVPGDIKAAIGLYRLTDY